MSHTREIDSLHAVINKYIPEKASGRIAKFGTADPPRATLMAELGKAYDELGMSDFWEVVKDYAP